MYGLIVTSAANSRISEAHDREVPGMFEKEL